MKFGIEIKPTYTIITPETEVMNKEVVEAILKKTEEVKAATGQYLIIDLNNIHTMELNALDQLLALHETIYAQDGSIVFTGLQNNVMQKMKQERLHLSINLTPTMEEAIDIISMEIMERDLLNEL